MPVDYEKVFRVERNYTKARHPEPADEKLQWLDAHAAPLRLSGFAWFAQDRLYRRMPKHPQEKLPPDVDGLADCTAGGQAAFRTDSPRVAVRVKLNGPPDAWNISPIGQCGVDGYVGDPGFPRRMRYAGSPRLEARKDAYCSWLYECLPPEMRTVTLNFPLYRGVERFEIGVDPSARLEAPPSFAKPGPVIVYGTSVTQGASASRPGMLFTNILSRRLNLEFVNLGFSGSALCEPEVARAIVSMPLAHEPSGLVMDCDSNIRDTKLLMQRHPAFLKILRERWPRVPLLVTSKPPFMTETLHPEVVAYRLERRDFLRNLVAGLRVAGDANVYFQDGSDYYGEDWDECTIDQRHATDLGFYRMAAVLEPLMEQIFLQAK